MREILLLPFTGVEPRSDNKNTHNSDITVRSLGLYDRVVINDPPSLVNPLVWLTKW